jgi:acetylornithine deacetylase/succinyl-diaminopimelate desuccinylase-like protein
MTGRYREHVRRDRLADDLWELVSIPSPTLRERPVAFRFAELLASAGATVTIDETVPESPSVIGRLRGRSVRRARGDRPGEDRTIQLAGHLDHIDVPHPAPERTEHIISGRGSADMKNGLAGILEIIRVLGEAGRDFPGEVLVTAYGQHEAPLGNGATLRGLIDRGIHGDAAIVFEGPEDRVVVMGKGQSIWNVRISRQGEVCHELRRPEDADALLDVTARILGRLLSHRDSLAGAPHDYPLLGPESIFVGQVHYGDFYNRAPTEATFQGTWRWHPNKDFARVKEALRTLLAGEELPPGISIENTWFFVGEAFSIEPDEPIVRALQSAYRSIAGVDASIAGSSTILDVNRLVPFARIPAVGIGLGTGRAHADYEFTRLDAVERGCRIALDAVVNFLHEEP